VPLRDASGGYYEQSSDRTWNLHADQPKRCGFDNVLGHLMGHLSNPTRR